MSIPVITIDGPAGTGKGTVAHLLAKKLNWHYLDSGALYRVLAYIANQKNIAEQDADALAEHAARLKVDFQLDGEANVCVLLDGQDISRAIRTSEIGQLASRISSLPAVRAALLEEQKGFCQLPGLVADGRDMGTVVFPEAGLKLYFTAEREERARRRYNQLKEQGIRATLSEIVCNLAERDARDETRKLAPLKPAADAVVLDTTHTTVSEVLDKVLHLIDVKQGLFTT